MSTQFEVFLRPDVWPVASVGALCAKRVHMLRWCRRWREAVAVISEGSRFWGNLAYQHANAVRPSLFRSSYTLG